VFVTEMQRNDLHYIKLCLTGHSERKLLCTKYTVCPTRYRTRHFFNNSNTNEDIATKFEQEYVRCVRNEEECVRSAPNIFIGVRIIKEMPGLVASGTPCRCDL